MSAVSCPAVLAVLIMDMHELFLDEAMHNLHQLFVVKATNYLHKLFVDEVMNFCINYLQLGCKLFA